ncbi:MAG: hypothetical protein O9293_13865 [Porphyrobacter sp.]|nr:hypothetical protein [Porphyrobacter sp.]
MSGLAASSVEAGYGYCEVYNFGSDRLLLSGSLNSGEDGENRAAIKDDFAAAMDRPVNRVECDFTWTSANDAEEYRNRKIAAKVDPIDDTGWTGRFAAIRNVEKPKPSGAFISIKDNGNAARAKAWDNALLQSMRGEAERKASIAAQTAESKAKYKQIMDKVIAEAKKRGNRQ